jgi:hypothetical protein
MAKKRGRRPKGEYAGKSEVMSFRITPAAKAALTQASRVSGRSLSQEAEHQIRRALLDMGAGPTYALLKVIGNAIDSLVNLKNPDAHWTTDAYLFDQACKAIVGALELFRPEGTLPESIEDALEVGGRMQGRLAVLELLRQIQIADPSIPLVKQTPHQRALVMLQADLGQLAERPRIYGMTAEQAREEHKIAVRFNPLMRKAGKNPEAVTPEEAQQLWTLAGKLADLAEAREGRKP